MKLLKAVMCLALAGSVNARVFAVTRDDVNSKPGWEDFQADLERRVALEVEAARSTAEAEEHYRNGVQLLRRSHRDEAVSEFRKAESTVLDAGEEAYLATSLRSYLHELRSKIAAAGIAKPIKPAPGKFEENQIGGTTLKWLSATVRSPIPQESAMREIFRNEGVPGDLIYVGLVESEYRPDAISSAGAVGPWQFIDDTGRRYGLRRGKGGDDRRNLLKSTRAAARYLRDLYELLGDWTLAVAGYNAGEHRVLRAMQVANTTDFQALRSYLPKETAAYVPRVLAAISIAQKARPAETVAGNVGRDSPAFRTAPIE